MSPAIGDKVWVRGDDHRQGAEPWTELEIIGETRISWVVGPAWAKQPEQQKHGRCYAKRTFPQYGLALSEDDKRRYEVVSQNWKLGERVSGVRDYDTLKAIEALVVAYEKRG